MRRAAVIVGGGLFAMTAISFLRPPLVPEIGRDLGLSTVELGALASAFALGRLLADIPAGHSTDRFDRGPMMAFGAAMIAVGTAGMGFSTHRTWLFLSSTVLGAGSAWVLATSMAFFAAAPKRRRGLSLSIFGGSLLTGQAVGPAVAGITALWLGWRGVLLGGAVLAVVAGAAMVRLDDAPQPAPPKSGGTGIAVGRHVIWIVYLFPAVQFAVGAAIIQTLMPIVADASLGYSSGIVGIAIGIGGLLRLVASIAAGQISDRVSRKAALLPGLVLQVAGLAVFALDAGPGGWWMAIVLLTLGSVSVNVGGTILADLTEGTALGRRLGAFRFTGDASFLVMPLISGWLFERAGVAAATAPLAALAGFVLLASIVAVPETNPRHTHSA